MKKSILFSILFFAFLGTLKSQVYRYIPDSSFRYVLRTTYSCPFDVSGDSLDISSTTVTGMTEISCGWRSISSLEGVEYFTSLSNLNCEENNLTSLPALPSALTVLVCSYNHLTSLPVLPLALELLDCHGNNLTSIPTLPSTLTYLMCGENNIETLPMLPISLERLRCLSGNLTSLPTLPSRLWELECGGNLLTNLPPLPDSLKTLNCADNIHLNCLPYIPSHVYEFIYGNTAISCLPNIISGATYIPPIGTYPLCYPYIDSCPSFTSISGILYQDNDLDCVKDSLDLGIRNINVIMTKMGGSTSIMSSYEGGFYSSDTMGFGFYISHIDTSELPFSVRCPLSFYDSILIDSSHLSDMHRDFALQCKPGFDLGTTGLYRRGQIRPATPAPFTLHAGDMASLFGAHCTSISGIISLDYTGPMHYTSVVSGTLVPDSVLPNRLVWNIPDFSTLDFNDDIKPNFFVDSSAILGDLVCFTTTISPISGDRVPSNNTYSQCFEVRASYDPNIKEVSPAGSVTSSQGLIYYTIHFQNTGNSFAENIYVWDTIDANLDLNTIQVMSSSHDQFMQVYPNLRAVKFNFRNINLVDSTSDEPNSHGFVQYRIKLKNALSEGTTIHNTASILFDLNTPIVTNTTNTIICNTPSNITQTFAINDGLSIAVGTHHYSKTGKYTDILTNMHGCDSVVKTIIQVISGIENISPSRILCYPNPANNSVLVQLEGLFQEPLVVYDIYGRKIFSGEFISNKYIINTESFSAGTYIIQCGNKHQKLVVKH